MATSSDRLGGIRAGLAVSGRPLLIAVPAFGGAVLAAALDEVGGLSPRQIAFGVMSSGLFAGVSLLLAILALTRRGQWIKAVPHLALVFWYVYPQCVISAMYLLDPLASGAGDSIESGVAARAAAFICLTAGTLVLFSRPSRPRSGTTGPPARVASRDGLIYGVAAAAALAGLAPHFASIGSPADILDVVLSARDVQRPWETGTNLGNAESGFAYLASSVGLAGAALCLTAALLSRIPLWARATLLGVAVISGAVISIEQGTRSLLALFALPALILWLTESTKDRRRSRARRAVLSAAAAVGLIAVAQVQMAYRVERTRDRWLDVVKDRWYLLGGTSDYFSETCFALQLVPAEHPFFRESAILQFLSFPVPRAVWPNKPYSEVAAFYTWERWKVDVTAVAGNTFPGIIGQSYMSWGVVGILGLGVMLAALAHLSHAGFVWACARRSIAGMTTSCMAAVWLFVTFRFLSAGFFFPVAVSAAIAALDLRGSDERRPRVALDRVRWGASVGR